MNRNSSRSSINMAAFIRNYANSFDAYFKQCMICNGTGLKGTHKMQSGGYSWGGEFCDECEGTGYIGWKDSELIEVCEVCKGEGCKRCGYKGMLDWIQMATGVNK